MKFTRKRHVVEAVQYDGYTERLPYGMGVEIIWSSRNAHCVVQTENGPMHCYPSNWIVKSSKGFSVYTAEQFEEDYEPM